MELERISTLTIEELKNFLRLRGLKVTGRKDELVARVFVAAENDAPVIKTAEEVQREIKTEYQDKLIVECTKIPDPLTLNDGWLSEQIAVKYWPMTLYPDIFNFLKFHPNELASDDLNDYKMSKAYSYYAEGWLSPLDFHNINGDSKLCILRGSCRPSQRLSGVPHKLWICLSKETGKIMVAHCSCMAGMSQTCNHVAAALFRIEAACRMGLNNPSCTSKANEWLPNTKVVEPAKVKNLNLGRNNFGQRSKKRKELNSSPKKNYNPLNTVDYRLSLQDVADAMKPIFKEDENIIFTALPKEDLNVATALGPQAQSVQSISDLAVAASSKEEFFISLYLINDKDIAEIEKITRGQSDNPLWFSFRQHVITASKAHDIKTRMETAEKKALQNEDFDTVVHLVSGESSTNQNIPAIKYGRSMEAEAVENFRDIFCSHHKDVTISVCGLFLSKEIPIVGGSPDRIVSCSCCGKFCLEIKCPSSISHTSPLAPGVCLPYLKKEGNCTFLHKNHRYHTQCQIQMAVTGVHKNIFFVWSAHGHYMETVFFNEENWESLKSKLFNFYNNIYFSRMFKK